MARRQVSVFIDGKQVEGTLANIYHAKRRITSQLNQLIEGSDEYNKKIKELDPLNAVINRHRTKLRGVETTYDKIKAGLGRFVGVAAGAFAVSELVHYGKELFILGGQMELLGKKAKTVFGEALPLVTREAEHNAAAMGMTEDQYVSAAAAIGDLLIPMGFQREESANMSTNLVNLSGALSEWTGGQVDATRVSQILSKAMLGEREELKQLGIAIQEADVKARLQEKGLEKLTGTMLQQAKATATLELIMEKSVDAQTAFGNNNDSLIRKQAELSARIETVVAKLASALIPVFHRLVGVAEQVADGIEGVAGFIGAMVDPVNAAAKAVDEQASSVSQLETELIPLLDRYEELKDKSELTGEEQDELANIIKKVGELTPTAITEIDKYGAALSINASASREFLEAEKNRLLFVNQEAISTIEKQIGLLESQAKIQKRLAETGETGGIISVDLSADEISAAANEYARLSTNIEGARAELARLSGDNLEETNIADTIAPPQIDLQAESQREAARKEREKEAERQLKERERNLQKLADLVADYQEEERLAALSADEEKLERIRLSYQKQIELATELESQGIAAAKDQRLELERLQQQALTDLTLQLMQERTDAENELAFQQLQQEIQRDQEAAAKRAEVVEELNGFVRDATLSEQQLALQELQAHYDRLIAMAEQHEIDTLDVKIAYDRERQAIIDEFRNKELEDAQAANTQQAEALEKAFTGLGSVVSATMELLGNESKKQSHLAKTLALIEIGVSSASALAKATASAAGLPFPANIPAIASAVATVLGNMAQARKILSDTPAVPQRYMGGYFDVTGDQDGKNYKAQYLGRRETGLLPASPSLVLASEHGPEYFVSHSDLQNPVVVNHVRAIENIRRFGNSVSVPQFAEGGFTNSTQDVTFNDELDSTTTSSELPPQLMGVLASLASLLNDIRENGLEAYISDDTLVNMQKRLNAIDRAAGKA